MATDPFTRSRAAQGVLGEPERRPGGTDVNVLQGRRFQSPRLAFAGAYVQGAEDIHHEGGSG